MSRLWSVIVPASPSTGRRSRSAGMISRPGASLTAVLLAALLGASCGAQSPQVPVAQANRVSSALTGIAEACGESYQGGAARLKSSLRPGPGAEAASRARELARVFSAYPERIYQGETLRRVVALAVADLRECGLAEAASRLVAEAR